MEIAGKRAGKHGTANQGQVVGQVVIFMMIKWMNSLRKKEEAAEEAAPPPPPKEEVLLEEIRDLLAKS